jgi:extradiol dioxygenase family protein
MFEQNVNETNPYFQRQDQWPWQRGQSPPDPNKHLKGFFCAILWVVIIVGLVFLIVYLAYRPPIPRFDVSAARLNAVYLNMTYLLNVDVAILANFTNTNKKVSVDFSYIYIDLFYGSTLIATQHAPPFSTARNECKYEYVHLVTSQVGIPLEATQRLKKQIERNDIMFQVSINFRARFNLGSPLRYSYFLHSHCTIRVAGPPAGALIRSECKTNQ